MNKIAYSLYLLLLCCNLVFALPNFEINRIDPPNWWVGMNNPKLQLCIFGKNISAWQIALNYPGVKIDAVNKVENPDYLFIDLSISREARAGKLILTFTSGKEERKYDYVLKPRTVSHAQYQGVDSRDLIYMLMPDRFANADPTNDIDKTARETKLNRDSMFYRHGGDLQGVIDHLDYIKDLGATALWLTPFQENNEKLASYHGYAITDHYKTDPRFGTNELYEKLVKEAHQKGLKVVMDMVYNHIGSEHWWMHNLPTQDWIHQQDTFIQTNYRLTALMDPHASEYDKNKMSNGWFVRKMPDLNQRNPYLANYLIQNAIWWIESSGIDGFRLDTYAYSDLEFMNRLLKSVREEYPKFSAVGEVWDHAVSFQAWLTNNNNIKGSPESHLPGTTDFQLYFALTDALNNPTDWTGGLAKIYYTLAQDFLYSKPDNNLTFIDNHDLSRFYSVVGEDIRKFKMGLGFLLTMRGTPSIYYGTELLMKNYANPDGKVRADFPGGWAGDTVNKFKASGRTKDENEIFNYIQKLARYRQSDDALQTGKLTQFVPENDAYVYFRSNEKSTVMVVMYTGKKDSQLSLNRFGEMFSGFKSAKDVIDDSPVDITKPVSLEPYTIRIVKLEK